MIKINDDYFVDVDAFNYTAKTDTHKVDKKGQRIIYTIGYYSDLRNAVKGILEYDAKQKFKGVDLTLYEAVKELDKNNKQLEKILAKIPSKEEVI